MWTASDGMARAPGRRPEQRAASVLMIDYSVSAAHDCLPSFHHNSVFKRQNPPLCYHTANLDLDLSSSPVQASEPPFLPFSVAWYGWAVSISHPKASFLPRLPFPSVCIRPNLQTSTFHSYFHSQTHLSFSREFPSLLPKPPWSVHKRCIRCGWRRPEGRSNN
jgi:hypothetical protein